MGDAIPPVGWTPAAIAALAQQARAAAARLRARTPASPLIASPALSARYGCEVLLKCEQLLPTGSFKFRGGFNKLALLSDRDAAAGVVAASTGNHGRAVALAARERGVRARVHAPAAASPTKLAAIAAEGAELVLHDGDPLAVEVAARAAAEAAGATYISPYNDLDVIAGQGGIAVELLAQSPGLDAVVVSVGGGGLACGIGAVLAAEAPGTELIAVWPDHATSLLASMRAGHAVAVDERPTLSDATAGGVEPGAVTIALLAALAPQVVSVGEDRIAAAMVRLATEERWIVEGAAALALAGLEAQAERLRGKRVAVVLCGRNILFDTFLSTLSSLTER